MGSLEHLLLGFQDKQHICGAQRHGYLFDLLRQIFRIHPTKARDFHSLSAHWGGFQHCEKVGDCERNNLGLYTSALLMTEYNIYYLWLTLLILINRREMWSKPKCFTCRYARIWCGLVRRSRFNHREPENVI